MQPAWEETAARLAGEVVYVPYPAIRYPTVEYYAIVLERVGSIATAIPHTSHLTPHTSHLLFRIPPRPRAIHVIPSNPLHAQVNVAEIDVTAARNIGTRFDVKGFPTLLLLRAGKVYKYKGRRVADDLVTFAQGGFSDSEPTDVPEPMGLLGPLFKVRSIEPHLYYHHMT
jgi:hypothetical protein